MKFVYILILVFTKYYLLMYCQSIKGGVKAVWLLN